MLMELNMKILFQVYKFYIKLIIIIKHIKLNNFKIQLNNNFNNIN